jgi:hypothetical protein
MNDWWKAPVLQGPENDYGQYDYLIEEIPEDYARWEFDREYKWKCHTCGRESHLLFRSEHFFHTLDGWDSMDYAECWRCRLSGKIHGIKWKMKKRIKVLKTTMELYKDLKKKSFKRSYELAKKIVR